MKKLHEKNAPIYRGGRYRPWLWPIKILREKTDPIQPGLWLVNMFFQRILDINNDIPWMVHFTSRVTGKIKIGKNVWVSFAISGGCYIQGINGIEIGDNTIFAPGIKIISANHDLNDLSKSLPENPIKIGRRCWIASNAVILPGVELGDDIIVAAGSIVTKSFPSKSIIGGNPAKILKVNNSLLHF
jgi:acetyltransferase-like isoleucine patch superfamily enzyme